MLSLQDVTHTITSGGALIADFKITAISLGVFLLLKLVSVAQDAIVKIIAFVDNFITTFEEEEMSRALNKYRSAMVQKLSTSHDDPDENTLFQEGEDPESDEVEPIEEAEQEDPETYPHEWTCDNCKHVQTDDFPFGTTVEDALGRDVECEHCGCY